MSDDEGVVFFQNWDPERMLQAGDGRKTNAMLEGTRKDSGRSPAVKQLLKRPAEVCHWSGGKLMKSLAKKMQRFLVSEDGPTAVEYAVMLALIVIVCLTAISSIGTQASATFQNVATELTPTP